MPKNHKILFVVLGFVFLLLFVSHTSVLAAEENGPISPSILNQNPEIDYYYEPLVTGLTVANSKVLIYIDDIFVGEATVNSKDTATDNFYFQVPSLSFGKHQLTAIAEDKTSKNRSQASNPFVFTIIPVPAPTLYKPNKDTITAKAKPLLTGLTISGSEVLVYIDGRFNGSTGIVKDPSGTANFVYEPFLNLNVGSHTVWAVSKNIHGRKSKISNILHFNIEEKLPAPIIFDPVVNKHTDYKQPFIIGLSKNDLNIKVFIDHKLNGEFNVIDNESGTANFAYKPFLPLAPGKHMVYTVATDLRGKESAWSNIKYFSVGAISIGQISDQAVSEKAGGTNEEAKVDEKTAEVNIEVKKLLELAKRFDSGQTLTLSSTQLELLEKINASPQNYNIDQQEQNLLKNLLLEQKKDIDQESKTDIDKDKEINKETDGNKTEDIEDIINNNAEKEKQTGSINESQEKQGKLNLNLIIFIVFLLAVIIWIFWVNRELIKERKESNKDNKTN